MSEKDAVEEAPDKCESVANDEKSNGEVERPKETCEDEACGTSEEPTKTTERKGPGQLKPPRVLEVFIDHLLL